MTINIKSIEISGNNLVLNYTGGGPSPDPSNFVACTYSKTYANPSSIIQQDSTDVEQMVSRCKSKNKEYINTSDEATCIINSNSTGYDYDKWTPEKVCIHNPCMINDDKGNCVITTKKCTDIFTKWKNKGVTTINYDNKEMMLGIGHGVLKGGRSQCAILEYNNKYAAVFQVDARTWSLEITEDTWKYLTDSQDPGGECFIPKVKSVDCNEIIKLL